MQNDIESPMSKDEIKKINYTKGSKIWEWKKIIWGIKIFKLRVKLNWKIALIKRKINQKNEDQTEKKTKKLIEGWKWKQKNSTKMPWKKIKIRTKMQKKKHMKNCNWKTKLTTPKNPYPKV